MRKTLVALLLPIPLIAGCSSQRISTPSAVPATQAAERQFASSYKPGRPGIDDDRDADPPDPIGDFVLFPFREIGSGFAAAFAWPADLIEKAEGDTPRRAVMRMTDKHSADNRRNGLNRLMEWQYTHQPPYTRVYEGMASLDDDPTVRAAAIRACNRSRDRKATPVFIKALSDQNEQVRLEAAKGLANLPDPNAAAPLTKLANSADESLDVRIAAIDALKYYRTLEVARVLSGLLADPDFSVNWQARRSLVFLTHKDFAYDQGAWLAYFVGPQKPLG